MENPTTMDDDNKKPFKIKDITRNIKKSVVAASLEEIRAKVAEKFEKAEQTPTIHLDSDGTEIDDEEYFRTLDANTELIAVFHGERWIDPTHYVTITSHREPTDSTDAATETARIQQLVGQLQNNLCNVSVLNDADLESLSNMDPNSLVDITGKDFIMDSLKDSGRPLCAKRSAEDRINLLKLLKEGAIFCSERYPEEAEAIDMEISRQLNAESTTATTTTTITTTTKTKPTTAKSQNKTIEPVQNAAAAAAEDVADGKAAAQANDAAASEAATVAAATTSTTATPTSNTNNKSNDI